MTAMSPQETPADRLLARIRRRPKHPYDAGRLVRSLDLTEAALVAAVDELRSWGYSVASEGKRIRFVGAPDVLSPTEIAFHLKSKRIGAVVHAYQAVKSTNDLAMQLARDGLPEGTIVVAEQQTKGRGRHQRAWYSPLGTGVYVSIILRPAFAPEQAPGLSLMTALALAETIEPLCPGRVQIKWPNDVLISGRKTAGILTELTAERDTIEHVVVGVGINVNQRREDFPAELLAGATSVRLAARRKQSRIAILTEFLRRFEREYARYGRRGLRSARPKLRAYSSLIGQTVGLALGPHEIRARVHDIGSDGALVIETSDGLTAVTSGEVQILKRQ